MGSVSCRPAALSEACAGLCDGSCVLSPLLLTEDFQALSKQCHTLKGVSGNLALIALSRTFGKLELAAKNAAVQICHELLAQAAADMAAVEAVLEESTPADTRTVQSSKIGKSTDELLGS